MTDKKRKYKSLIHDVPNKVEITKKEHEMQNVLTVEELEEQLEEAIKGKARVDSKYVDYQSRGHLYDYKINYTEFLDDMAHIMREVKARPEEERYKSRVPLMIQ